MKQPTPSPSTALTPSTSRSTFAAACAAALVLLAGCGGGSEADDATAAAPSTEATTEAITAATTAEASATTIEADARQQAQAATDPRIAAGLAAATATATSTSNGCAAIRPFYWEVGNRDGRQASGSVLKSRTGTIYSSTTPVALASASKWLYGAYVVERKGGAPDAGDIKFLTMRGGYTSFDECQANHTVQSCLDSGSNGTYTAAHDGSFFYNGGHMQKHASINGLGAMGNAALAAEVRSQIGKEIVVSYTRPQPAGGAVATPDAYAKFLRKLLKGELKLGNLLGSSAACTSPSLCPAGQATYSPVEQLGNVHYSLGHWVEDDASGDGALSSAGTLGFYPWIDAGRTTYGIVSRMQTDGGPASRLCGRLIRKAWLTGATQ